MQGAEFIAGIIIMVILIATLFNVVIFYFTIKFFFKIHKAEKQITQDLLTMERMKRTISKEISDVVTNIMESLEDKADGKDKKDLPDVP